MKLEHNYNHIVFPEDANHMGTIFGGKLVSIIDLAVAQHTMFLLKEENSKCDDAVTVNFSEINFHFGAVVGDLLTIESVLDRIGIKSMAFSFWVRRLSDNRLIATGKTTFVARKNGIAHPHGIDTFKREVGTFLISAGDFKATVEA